MKDKLFTINEVAEMLSVTHKTVRNLIAKGEIKAIKIGGSIRIKESVIKNLIQE